VADLDPIEELLAKQAITEQLHRYCHGLDRFDREQADIWHPGGTASYEGIFEGTGEGFLDWVWPVHETMERTSHQVTNILITLEGPDRATSETYVTMCGRTPKADIVGRGRYLDTWSKRDGRWGVDARRYADDIQQFLPREAPSS
jgi:hypothetical protein